MNWYRLWEVHCKPAAHYTHSHAQKVIYRFRSKIKARLDAVAIILFSIPVGLLTALIVSFFLPSACFFCLLTVEQAMLFSKSGTTPKFFVMCLFISALFLAVVSWNFSMF